MMLLFRQICFGLALSISGFQIANAWQTGVDYDVPLECDGLPMAGADEVVVRVNPANGSFGFPTLVGIKGKKMLWKQNFPSNYEVNVANLDASCKDKIIRLRFQNPAENVWIGQQFMWDGTTIKWLRNEPIK